MEDSRPSDPRGFERLVRRNGISLLTTILVATFAVALGVAPDRTTSFLAEHGRNVAFAVGVLYVVAGALKYGPRLAQSIGTWIGGILHGLREWWRARRDRRRRQGQSAGSDERGSDGRGFFARHRFTTLLLALLPLAGVAVWYTFTQVGALAMGLSGHAAGLASAAVLVLAYALFDQLPFREVDTFEQIREGNLAVALFSGIVFFSFALVIFGATSVITTSVQSAEPTAPDTARASAARQGAPPRPQPARPGETYSPHVDTALTYVGTVERGENRGPEVERFLSAVGLGPGYPWCAAFDSYCMKAAGATGPPIDARSRMLITERSVMRPAVRSALSRGREVLQRGMLTVHRYTRYRGHAGILVGQDGRTLRTVEGNTSGPRGQREGVWRKRRRLVGSNYLAPLAFTPVSY
jgi:hypothetical protein